MVKKKTVKKTVKGKTSKKIMLIFCAILLCAFSYSVYYFIKEKDITLTLIVDETTSCTQVVHTKMSRAVSDLQTPQKEGYVFNGWYHDADFKRIADPAKIFLLFNKTLYAKMDIIKFSAVFENNGGSKTETIVFNYGTIPIEPDMPEKADYMFCGWYSDEGLSVKYGFDTVINGDLALYADWELVSDALIYSQYPDGINITGYKAKIPQYLYLPEKIENCKIIYISDNAFLNCSALKEVNIFDKDIYIGQGIFKGCENIEKMTLAFAENVNKGYNTTLNYYFYGSVPASLKTVTVAKGTYGLAYGAFGYCIYLEKVNLPESIVSIDGTAFSYCQSLESIYLPAGINYIGNDAFSYCSKINGIVIPSQVKILNNGTFSFCSSLKDVTLSPNLERIGSNVFYGCSGLVNIDIPKSVNYIGQQAFMKCGELKSIVLPDGIIEIPNSAFHDCTKLISVKTPANLTKIGDNCFRDCSALSFEIPQTVTEISTSAFYGCSFIDNIVIPSGLTVLGSSVFSNCINLKNITLSEGLADIYGNAFYGCTAVSKISLPSTLKNLDVSAFINCSSLDTLTVLAPEPPKLTGTVNFTSFLKIYVPADFVNAYKTAAGWSAYASRIDGIT